MRENGSSKEERNHVSPPLLRPYEKTYQRVLDKDRIWEIHDVMRENESSRQQPHNALLGNYSRDYEKDILTNYTFSFLMSFPLSTKMKK